MDLTKQAAKHTEEGVVGVKRTVIETATSGRGENRPTSRYTRIQ